MLMYNIYLLLFILSVLDESTSSDISELCDNFTPKLCTRKFKPEYCDFNNSSSEFPPCSYKDLPKNIIFMAEVSSGNLRVKFKPPTAQCRYKVSLLLYPSPNSVEECERTISILEAYRLDQIICHYMSDVHDKSIILYKNMITLKFNVSPGCYALRFDNFDNYEHTIGNVYISSSEN